MASTSRPRPGSDVAAGKGDPGREPVTVVSIEQDLCSRTYGVAPCTAAIGVTGSAKCYNTRRSCQDSPNFLKGSGLPLNFVNPESGPGFIQGFYLIPMLVAVSSSPARLNIGGRPRRDGSLGKRASITITMQDAPHPDTLVDPYLATRTFDPLERSTFWAKWLKRNPFYNGRPLQVVRGYAGQTPAEFITEHYIIDKIEGPDTSGKVTIRASDILRMADDDQAKAPELSTGEVAGDFLAAGTTFQANGAAAGDYDAAGIVRIGREVITYTSAVFSAGAWVFTGLTRGSRDTVAADQKAGATVQRCLDVVGLKAWEVIKLLLVTYAGVPSAYVDDVAWAAEADRWTGNFILGRLITSPIGVAQAIGEICEQAMITIWWDPEDQEIKLRAVRPSLPDERIEISETFHLIQGSTKIKVRPEERLTEVWVSYGLRDPTLAVNDRASYENTRKRVDEAAASSDQYGVRRVYEILSPWLVSEAQVSPLSFRMLSAYRDNPGYLTGLVDAKDREIGPGQVVDIDARAFVDFEGEPEPKRFEVIQREELAGRDRIRLEMQPSQFISRYAYIMADATGVYTTFTESNRPELAWWFSSPGVAGPAENFADGLGPYVFI